MKNVLRGLAIAMCVLVSGFAAIATAGDTERQRIRSTEVAETMSAQLNSVLKLDGYLKRHFNEKPLAYLSERARTRFVDSLSFNENGLTSFRYDDLEAELTYSQAQEILKLFGAQGKIFSLDLTVASDEDAKLFKAISRSPVQILDDHKEYKCIGRYNCYAQTNYICLSGCANLP